MKSIRLIVKGRVQKVGYRSLVDEIAFALGVKGQVKNLEDRTVEIIAEHDEENVLEAFIEKIKIEEYPIRVTEVVKEETEPKGFAEFEVIEGPLELENRESLEAGAVYMRRLASSMDQMNSSMKNMDSGMEKMNSGMEKMNSGMSELNKEQKLMRTELGEKFDSGFARVEKKLDSFSLATTDRFDVVDTKYGKISDRLEKISDSLEELVDILRAFKPRDQTSG